jgi:tRNA dimethylallyltransferase
MPGPLEHPPQLWLAGPTAAGKSEIALLLARRLNAEIVSVDSMQVYRGLDVGTAKPSPAERARVPHHLLDVADGIESFDAARFLVLARAAIADIERRGRLALLCGGTGLYFKALLEGLGEGPPANAALRQLLEQTPRETLLAELAAADPITFERIDRKNPRRIIRAVEILRLTGRPPSAQRAAWSSSNSSSTTADPARLPASTNELDRGANDAAREPVVFVLRRAPEDLRARIDARVDQMFAAGWVAETERLLALGLAQNRTAMQAIGYRQIVEHQRGVRSLEETRALIKTKTRQFARRQMTWFRRQLPVHWIDVAPAEPGEAVAERIRVAFDRICAQA